MRGLIVLLFAFAYLAISAEPAGATGLEAVILKIGAWVTSVSSTTLGAIVVRTVVAVGVSLIQQKFAKKKVKEPKDPGIQTNQTTSGGTQPQATVLGWSSTGGHLVYHNSHGSKNKYYQMVIEVSDLPGLQLSALYLDGEKCTLGGTHASFGQEITNKRNGSSARAWIKYYDGSQTAADPMLVNRYGSDPDRPWTADHKLTGICYAILTFLYDRKVFPSDPQAFFEMHGAPLYDPRKDSTVGGSGTHRWDQPATYEVTTNPIVISYNILRGVTLPDGSVWGGRVDFEDVPLDNWVPAMNACDADVDGRPRFRFGMEIAFNEQPRDIIQEALASCNGQISEIGGVYKVMVAEPAPAMAVFTDDDTLVSEPSERDPFPGIESTYNAIVGTRPAPEALWNQSQLPVISYPDWETEDGGRRQLSVSLPGVPWKSQGQQVLDTMLKDERRFLRHRLALPPDFDWIEPLMTLGWTSSWNGYAGKLFEVAEVAYDLKRLIPTVSLRERDPADAAHVPGLELPDTPGTTTPIVRIEQPVPGFDLLPVTIDVGGQTRRPALKAVWDVEELGDVEGVTIELRLAGETAIVWQQTITDVSLGEKVIEPVLPAQGYEGRPRVYSTVSEEPWGAWVPALTSAVRMATDDIADDAVTTAKIGDAQITTAKIGDAQITNAKIAGSIQSDNYIPNVSGWIVDKSGFAQFPSAYILGTISAAKLNLDGLTLENNGGQLQIKSAGVNTAQVTANAITSSQAAYRATYDAATGYWRTVTSVSVSSTVSGTLFMTAYTIWQGGTGVRLTINGTPYIATTGEGSSGKMLTLQRAIVVGAGTFTVAIQALDAGAVKPADLDETTLFAQILKR